MLEGAEDRSAKTLGADVREGTVDGSDEGLKEGALLTLGLLEGDREGSAATLGDAELAKGELEDLTVGSEEISLTMISLEG